MKTKRRDFWFDDEEDDLAVSAIELEELENDELTLEEASFISGYD